MLFDGETKNHGSDHEIVISSFDSDFFQLITDKVHILRYRGDNTVLCAPAYIREKLGIEPSQYAEFKSLTAAQLLNMQWESERVFVDEQQVK